MANKIEEKYDSMEALLEGEKYEIADIRIGSIVEGKVIKVTKDEVELDLKAASEGKIYLDHLTLQDIDSCEKFCKVGDTITARVEKKADEGQIYLSRIGLEKNEKIEAIKNEIGSIVKAPVTRILDRRKKGLYLKYKGVEVFIPANKVDIRRVDINEEFIGKELEFELERAAFDHIVGNRSKILKDASAKQKLEQIAKIKIGDVVDATVDSIQPYGCFCKFGLLEGLLHISQIDHSMVKNVTDKLSLNQEIKVKIISIEGTKIGLSIKALTESPIEMFASKNKVGDTITGTVVEKLKFGLVLNLPQNITGFLHRNEFTHNPKNYLSKVTVGEKLQVQIIALDVEQRKVSLSKKALEENTWEKITENVGDTVETIVSRFDTIGMFCEFKGLEILIPYSEVSGSKQRKRAEDIYKQGDKVKCEIIKKVDSRWDLIGSIKKLETPEESKEEKTEETE